MTQLKHFQKINSHILLIVLINPKEVYNGLKA